METNLTKNSLSLIELFKVPKHKIQFATNEIHNLQKDRWDTKFGLNTETKLLSKYSKQKFPPKITNSAVVYLKGFSAQIAT